MHAPICHTISVPLCDRYLNWWFSNYPIFQSSFPGVSLEALCTPRSGELSSSQLCHCLSALKALLDNVWCREQLSSQQGIMIEICNIMHRQLLTQVQCSVDRRIFRNISQRSNRVCTFLNFCRLGSAFLEDKMAVLSLKKLQEVHPWIDGLQNRIKYQSLFGPECNPVSIANLD